MSGRITMKRSFAVKRTVTTLARRCALFFVAPAGVALALAASTAACVSSDPSAPIASGQPLGGGDSLRDGDIVTITGTRSRSGWNSAEHKLSPSAVAQSGLTRQWESPVLDSFTGTNPADGTTMTFPPTAWASPLIVKNVAMPGYAKKFGVLIIATGNAFI